ncbi:MAG: ATP-binding cassette domain-containing protein [Clostridiaceae bacterium]|nr:ATP-binding cassette domain-containing protein [Clostridiaceae bacterium]
MSDEIVSMKGICKSFGHVTALRGASFSALRGQVTAIVGDNGSGKSTLMKILCGDERPDMGEIEIKGQVFHHITPRLAAEQGITMVYQDLALDGRRDAAGNIFLGRELLWKGIFLRRKAMLREARRLLDELEINIPDCTAEAANLSGGQRQAVAVARAIHQDSEIIIMDEPTSAMGLRETGQVMSLIKRMKASGRSILMVSHNLFQVFDMADRIIVVKGGRCLAPVEAAKATPEEVNHMILFGEGQNE